MKKKLSKYLTLSNLITTFLLLIFIYLQAPRIWHNYQLEKIEVRSFKTISYSAKNEITFPPAKKCILIFWASWCAPCKLEMLRFNNAIRNGEIDKEFVFAINPFENERAITKFLHNNEYLFHFIKRNDDFTAKINVSATPTIIYLNKSSVEYVTSGISPLGILRARWFLRED